jgi:hypothetical protein
VTMSELRPDPLTPSSLLVTNAWNVTSVLFMCRHSLVLWYRLQIRSWVAYFCLLYHKQVDDTVKKSAFRFHSLAYSFIH